MPVCMEHKDVLQMNKIVGILKAIGFLLFIVSILSSPLSPSRADITLRCKDSSAAFDLLDLSFNFSKLMKSDPVRLKKDLMQAPSYECSNADNPRIDAKFKVDNKTLLVYGNALVSNFDALQKRLS